VILNTTNVVQNKNFKIKRRNWRTYSEEQLINQLRGVVWQTEIECVQEMWNSYEQEILTVVDRLAPLEEVTSSIVRGKGYPGLKKKQNRRSYLLKKRKRKNQTEDEKEELMGLNKFIRNYHYEERKQHIRKKIVPGNSKSLWDAVKIARDIEPTHLPTEMVKDGVCYALEDLPMAFSNHFESKIRDLEKDL
jgi:hypothetical protein